MNFPHLEQNVCSLDSSCNSKHDNKVQKSRDREELLTLALDLDAGNTDYITIYNGDKAEILASKLAKKHNLNEKMEEKLVGYIQRSINEVLVECNNQSTNSNAIQLTQVPNTTFQTSTHRYSKQCTSFNLS